MMDTCLKIALLAPASSVHAVRWANGYVERGHQVGLISQHAPLPGLDRRVQVFSLPFKGLAGYMLNRGNMKAALRAFSPHIVNVHYATGYGLLARGVTKFPLVLNVWGSDVYTFPDKSVLHRWLLKGNLAHADQVVSTSHAMAARVSQWLPYAAPAAVVPFGVDVDHFTPHGASKNEGGPLVIGTVKSLAPVYGIDRLMQAFAHLVQMEVGADVRLRIVGEGPQRKELLRLADKLGIADRLDMVGAVPHAKVPDELRKFNVYAALSRSESFGVAVIEASACGLPVVVSDAGGLPEVVRNGETGFVVPSGDPETAASKFHTLLTDPALRVKLGASGREFVLGNYEWSDCVDRMLEVLHETADTVRSRP